jgi:hypothetical protein
MDFGAIMYYGVTVPALHREGNDAGLKSICQMYSANRLIKYQSSDDSLFVESGLDNNFPYANEWLNTDISVFLMGQHYTADTPSTIFGTGAYHVEISDSASDFVIFDPPGYPGTKELVSLRNTNGISWTWSAEATLNLSPVNHLWYPAYNFVSVSSGSFESNVQPTWTGKISNY